MNIDVLNDLLNQDDIIFYYHVTNKNPENIISEGFYMIDRELYKTMIELPEEFILDPLDYSVNERGQRGTYRDNANVIIFGFNKDELDYIVDDAYYIPSNWSNDFPPNYFISNEYILGYIDTNKRDFVLNESYKYNCYLSI